MNDDDLSVDVFDVARRVEEGLPVSEATMRAALRSLRVASLETLRLDARLVRHDEPTTGVVQEPMLVRALQRADRGRMWLRLLGAEDGTEVRVAAFGTVHLLRRPLLLMPGQRVEIYPKLLVILGLPVAMPPEEPGELPSEPKLLAPGPIVRALTGGSEST